MAEGLGYYLLPTSFSQRGTLSQSEPLVQHGHQFPHTIYR